MPVLRVVLCTLAGFAASIAPSLAAAQEPPDQQTQQELAELTDRVDLFFKSLTDKALDPERAVREIIGNGPLKQRNDEIRKLIEQALSLDQRYGAYTGNERVSTQLVGADLMFFRYLYKGERFPVVWYFTFYRAAPIAGVKRDWSLIALRLDARLEALEK